MLPTTARSYLYVPGDNPRMIAKAFSLGSDAVVFDLEDAVLESRKRQSRECVAELLKTLSSDQQVFVRINSIDSQHWSEDLEAIVNANLTGVRIPKVRTAAEISQVDESLSDLERKRNVPDGSIAIVPLIENAKGLLNARELAKCRRVEAFCFGATDFLLDINAGTDVENPALLYAESHLVIVSRAEGLQPPIGSVFTSLNDEDGLRRSSLRLKEIGFGGRSCIHPSQIPSVNEVFAPSDAEIAQAHEIVDAAQRAAAADAGAIATDDGQFVDAAVLARARRVLQMRSARRGTE